MINNSNQTPANKTAALVIGKGVRYESPKKIQTIENENILSIRPATKAEIKNPGFKDVSGARIGRLKVIGLYRGGSGWVCRCDCGTYCVRKAKSILNENNKQDRCEECRHQLYLKRAEIYRKTGKDVDINDLI